MTMGAPLFNTLLFFFAVVVAVEAQGVFTPGGCRQCGSECMEFPKADGGCTACVCNGVILGDCPPVRCPIFCAQEVASDGCQSCNCNKSSVICPPLRPCPAECQQEKDENGCPSCKCPDGANTQNDMTAPQQVCPPVPACPLGCIQSINLPNQSECFGCNCTFVNPNPFGPNAGRFGGVNINQRPNIFRQQIQQGGLLPSGRQPICGEFQCEAGCRLCVGRDGCGRCLCGRDKNVCPAVPACRQSCIVRGDDDCLVCRCPNPGFGGFNPFRRPIRPISGLINDGAITLIITRPDDDTPFIQDPSILIPGRPIFNPERDDDGFGDQDDGIVEIFNPLNPIPDVNPVIFDEGLNPPASDIFPSQPDQFPIGEIPIQPNNFPSDDIPPSQPDQFPIGEIPIQPNNFPSGDIPPSQPDPTNTRPVEPTTINDPTPVSPNDVPNEPIPANPIDPTQNDAMPINTDSLNPNNPQPNESPNNQADPGLPGLPGIDLNQPPLEIPPGVEVIADDAIFPAQGVDSPVKSAEPLSPEVLNGPLTQDIVNRIVQNPARSR